MSHERAFSPAQRRYQWITLGVPIIFSLGFIALTIVWLPNLPAPVAMHWSGDEPDNFGNVWLVVALIVAISIAFGAFCYFAGRSPQSKNYLGPGAKLLGALSVWFSVMLTVGVSYSLYLQLGLSDAAQATVGTEVGIGLLISSGIGVVAGIIAWLIIPQAALLTPDQPTIPDPMPMAATEQVSFIEELHSPTWLQISLAIIAILSTGAIWYGTGVLWLSVIFGLVLFLTLFLLNWRISVNIRGVTITSLAGFPKFRYPIDTIAKASIADIDPAAEFGGWGFRYGFDGRYGIVIRKGPALHLERPGKKTFVITMNQAEPAARLINALLQPRGTASGTSESSEESA